MSRLGLEQPVSAIARSRAMHDVFEQTVETVAHDACVETLAQDNDGVRIEINGQDNPI
jgi:hypothetical protein